MTLKDKIQVAYHPDPVRRCNKFPDHFSMNARQTVRSYSSRPNQYAFCTMWRRHVKNYCAKGTQRRGGRACFNIQS